MVTMTRGSFAQESTPQERLTQEQFACETVKILHLEHRLPVAALPKDCVDLLESMGISPLSGWDPKAYLTREGYLVLIGKAQGKEGVIHRRAIEVEQKNTELINRKWKEAHDKTGQWPSLDQLLSDPVYFPKGAPKSPYGRKYRDADNDHQVDFYYSPMATLIEFREAISSQD